jgi:hypothetical protein
MTGVSSRTAGRRETLRGTAAQTRRGSASEGPHPGFATGPLPGGCAVMHYIG